MFTVPVRATKYVIGIGFWRKTSSGTCHTYVWPPHASYECDPATLVLKGIFSHTPHIHTPLVVLQQITYSY